MLTISWGQSGRALDWDQKEEWIEGVNVEHDPDDDDMVNLELPRGEEDPAVMMDNREDGGSSGEEGEGDSEGDEEGDEGE